jgi:hypothetical protein
MVVVVAGGGGALVVVVMVEDAWRAAHPSCPPAPRSPILTCPSTGTYDHIVERLSARQ